MSFRRVNSAGKSRLLPGSTYYAGGAAAFRYSLKGNPFPSDVMVMLKSPAKNAPNQHVFRIPMKYNKMMVKNYLEQLYGVSVLRVDTAIFTGRVKRLLIPTKGHQRKVVQYKHSDIKKAWVTFDKKDSFVIPALEAGPSKPVDASQARTARAKATLSAGSGASS